MHKLIPEDDGVGCWVAFAFDKPVKRGSSTRECEREMRQREMGEICESTGILKPVVRERCERNERNIERKTNQ